MLTLPEPPPLPCALLPATGFDFGFRFSSLPFDVRAFFFVLMTDSCRMNDR
jgi:hypothetical protein